jgi:hypothetical protein
MAIPRPLVAGVDTSVMMAVERDTFPVQKTTKKISLEVIGQEGKVFHDRVA